MKFALALIVAMVPFCLRAQDGAGVPLNGIVARVNDVVITYKELFTSIYSELAFLERKYESRPDLFEREARKIRGNAVTNLVERQLILNEFKTGGYNLPDSYIEDRIERDIRANYGNRLTLTRTLQAQGLTFETYRQKVREGVILDAMVDHFIPRDPIISPFKIETYYKEHLDKYKLEDQVKLRMIVVTNRPNDALYSPKAMAEEILAKIKEGAPFADMAKIYSQGSQSVEGGAWGWVERSVLRSDLGEVAFSLKAGQHSEVIERPDGCYLMLVEEVKLAHTRALSEVRSEIETTLKNDETKRLHDKWMTRLKAKSFVQYFPD
jgi:peptidyl-prolyl cis-trans isomerase SurA